MRNLNTFEINTVAGGVMTSAVIQPADLKAEYFSDNKYSVFIEISLIDGSNTINLLQALDDSQNGSITATPAQKMQGAIDTYKALSSMSTTLYKVELYLNAEV